MRPRPMSLLVLLLAACGGAKQQDTYLGTATNDGSGVPVGATADRCTDSPDCAYWFCACTDGAVVNSAFCHNTYCLDAASQCDTACGNFGHGAWTGTLGSNPGGGGSCGSLSSANAACDACYQASCCDQGAACNKNASCLGYWDCYVACTTSSCRASCNEAYPLGADDFGALQSCLVSACAGSCS